MSTSSSSSSTGAASGTSTTGVTGSSSTGAPHLLDCTGIIYQCGDGQDNDGDGLVDLLDPECTSPCDDDESSWQALMFENESCRHDCFWDGNSGPGDDGCEWNITCDPANPGANLGCVYTKQNPNCEAPPIPQSQACIDFCTPHVPPGCDCFGCCTVQTDNGPIDIYIASDPDCSLDDLGACQPCTSQIDVCGRPCGFDACELCFAQVELAPGCDTNVCPVGEPCETSADCPTESYCYEHCCYPPQPA